MSREGEVVEKLKRKEEEEDEDEEKEDEEEKLAGKHRSKRANQKDGKQKQNISDKEMSN